MTVYTHILRDPLKNSIYQSQYSKNTKQHRDGMPMSSTCLDTATSQLTISQDTGTHTWHQTRPQICPALAAPQIWGRTRQDTSGPGMNVAVSPSRAAGRDTHVDEEEESRNGMRNGISCPRPVPTTQPRAWPCCFVVVC
jgi:hypothetical protein